MSQVASWSYTAKATVWKLTGKDDWSGAKTFTAPVHILCDYKAEVRNMQDTNGNEFVSKQTIYTEYDQAAMGDMIKIGESVEADPFTAGAQEVRLVLRYADTFYRTADDWEIVT